jgi:hypothetical protein
MEYLEKYHNPENADKLLLCFAELHKHLPTQVYKLALGKTGIDDNEGRELLRYIRAHKNGLFKTHGTGSGHQILDIDRGSIEYLVKEEGGFSTYEERRKDQILSDLRIMHHPSVRILEYIRRSAGVGHVIEIGPIVVSITRSQASGYNEANFKTGNQFMELISQMVQAELIVLVNGWGSLQNSDEPLDDSPIKLSAKSTPFGAKELSASMASNLSSANVAKHETDVKSNRRPPGPIEVFISHSHLDEDFANSFQDIILEAGLEIHHKVIFNSSNEASKIKSGDEWRDSIKTALQSARVTFLIITQNYKQSEICLNEMGAAWVLSERVIPLVVAPITSETVGPISVVKQCEKLLDSHSLDRIRDTLEELTIINNRIINTRWAVKKTELLEKFKHQLDQNPVSFESDSVSDVPSPTKGNLQSDLPPFIIT